VPIITAVVTNRIAVGKTLGELAADRQIFRGVYLESLARGEEEMPRQARLMVERGDVLKLVGSPQDVNRAGIWLGIWRLISRRPTLLSLPAGLHAAFFWA
jgi:putative transport protein